jgi:2Fe-2S ferredoxin
MPTVIFVRADGGREEVAGRNGLSVMRTAIENNVDGIEAECGGCLDCATCHVYVDEAFLGRLAAPSDQEEALLQAVSAPRRDNSRLSCQIKLTDALDGLIVRIPERQ